MGVSVYLTSALYCNRKLSDIEDKITYIDRRMLAVSDAVFYGQMDLIQGHFTENELMARKKQLETDYAATKLILEDAKKQAATEAKKSFTLQA